MGRSALFHPVCASHELSLRPCQFPRFPESNPMAIQWFPGHMNLTRKVITERVKEIDVVIEVMEQRAAPQRKPQASFFLAQAAIVPRFYAPPHCLCPCPIPPLPAPPRARPTSNC